MKCPKCQFDNPEQMKFCGECGIKLEKLCEKCNFVNPPQFKFCGECGHDLTLPSEPAPKDLSFDEKLDKIQRYLPKGLTEKILSQKDKIEGERKQVTVMFCDMEGFTTIVEELGPEDAYSIMDQVYEILIHKVHDYEGTVNEMTGDGIMALFGAPIALEDAPQRAIRSAHAIHREMIRFCDKIKQEKEDAPAIKMRIGIHTGPVVVGTLGNDLRVEFKAVGDTVNLASRIEGLAEPGTTYVSNDTFNLTEGFFRFEALGRKAVKGKEEPVNVFRVIAPSTRRTRFDVSAARGLIPFVGRGRELELLLDGFERCKTGRGQAFSIISEAGLGKSRLLYEFRKAVTSEDVMFLEGRCLSYSRSIAYHPLIDILKANFDIREADQDSEIRKKVKKGLKILGADEASILPCFLELLSIKDSGIDEISMSPGANKDRVMEALKLITLKGAEIRPLILAFEDLHWLDKSSEEVMKYVLENIPGARVLMIFTYRPEFVHTWGGKSYHSQLNLNRLSNQESLVMITNLLDTKDIDSDLEDLILEKTEGVPFFLEEFLKSLKDLKIIERKNNKYHLKDKLQKVTIPSTIQDIIMARVDSMPEVAKEVLQTGSVIEREFSYKLIKKGTGFTVKELLSHFSVLKDSELLYERGIYPDTTYIFKHALTREVVYDSILSKKKMVLHEIIGQAMEELYKDNLTEYYGDLIKHFVSSEHFDKGAYYSMLAGKKAMKAAAVNDAIDFMNKQVDCLERLPQTEDIEKKMMNARTFLGQYLIYMNHHVESKEAVEPIINLTMKYGNKKLLSQIYTILGTYYYTVEADFSKAIKYLKDGLDISEGINDAILKGLSAYWLGLGLALNSEYKEALYYMGKSLKISRVFNITWAVTAINGVLCQYVYFFQGKFDLIYQASEEAFQIAEESGDIYSKSLAYAAKGLSCYCKAQFGEATQHLIRSADLAKRIDYFYSNAMANFILGETYYEIGKYQESKDHYCEALRLLEKNKCYPFWMNLFKIGFARSKVMNNEKDIDLESLFKYARENKVKLYDGWMSRYISEILLHVDERRISEAEDWINKALKADKTNGMMFHLGKDYSLYAELFKRKGNESKARENLNKAIEIFKQCGADGWQEKAELELASLS